MCCQRFSEQLKELSEHLGLTGSGGKALLVSYAETTQVEFVGGPLDGLIYVVSSSKAHLARNAAIPVNQNMIEMTCRADHQIDMRATSIAIYALENTPCGWQYHFRGAAPPEHFQLQDWIG